MGLRSRSSVHVVDGVHDQPPGLQEPGQAREDAWESGIGHVLENRDRVDAVERVRIEPPRVAGELVAYESNVGALTSKRFVLLWPVSRAVIRVHDRHCVSDTLEDVGDEGFSGADLEQVPAT